MNKNKRTTEIFVSGFALFAIFFGAGNLIFPPILGNMTGDSWWKAMLGFLATDPVLPILGVLAAELGGLLGASAVLLATESGDSPFDEACSRPWLQLQQRFGDVPIALACFAVTVELRGEADTDHQQIGRAHV